METGEGRYLTGLPSGNRGTARGPRTCILGVRRRPSSEPPSRYAQQPADSCPHCSVTATAVLTDLGPHWLGHNCQRVCKRCGKRWCSVYPNGSFGVHWSLCSPACKSAWYGGKRRECVVCGTPIPANRRADAKTCNGACRVALHRALRG